MVSGDLGGQKAFAQIARTRAQKKERQYKKTERGCKKRNNGTKNRNEGTFTKTNRPFAKLPFCFLSRPSFPCFCWKKGKENPPKKQGFLIPTEPLKIPGKEGENAQKKTRIPRRGKKKEFQKNKEGQGLESLADSSRFGHLFAELRLL